MHYCANHFKLHYICYKAHVAKYGNVMIINTFHSITFSIPLLHSLYYIPLPPTKQGLTVLSQLKLPLFNKMKKKMLIDQEYNKMWVLMVKYEGKLMQLYNVPNKISRAKMICCNRFFSS